MSIETDKTLRELFKDNAYNLLKGRARDLTLGDTWRFIGWSLPGDPPPNEDPVLGQLSMEEIKSIANALEVHVQNEGDKKGWKYTNRTYACGACTT